MAILLLSSTCPVHSPLTFPPWSFCSPGSLLLTLHVPRGRVGWVPEHVGGRGPHNPPVLPAEAGVGLGIGLCSVPYLQCISGIFVHTLSPGSVAHLDGRLRYVPVLVVTRRLVPSGREELRVVQLWLRACSPQRGLWAGGMGVPGGVSSGVLGC